MSSSALLTSILFGPRMTVEPRFPSAPEPESLGTETSARNVFSPLERGMPSTIAVAISPAPLPPPADGGGERRPGEWPAEFLGEYSRPQGARRDRRDRDLERCAVIAAWRLRE